MGRRKCGTRGATAATTEAATPPGGKPAGRRPRITQKPQSSGREMPPMPNPTVLRGRREEETHGDGTTSADKRPPGAGTGAIPKKLG